MSHLTFSILATSTNFWHHNVVNETGGKEPLVTQNEYFTIQNCAQEHEKSHKTIILHREAKEIRDIIFKLIKVANFSAFYVRPKIFENLSSPFGTVVN